MGACGGKS